jgi:hypothetical protein
MLAFSLVELALQETHNLGKTNVNIGYIPSTFLTNSGSPGSAKNTPPPGSPPSSPPPSKPSWDIEFWQKAHCRGAKFLIAISASEEKQRNILRWPYFQSTREGDLHAELEEWSYKGSDELRKNTDIFCDVSGSFYGLNMGFRVMGIDLRSDGLGAQIIASKLSFMSNNKKADFLAVVA